MQVAATGLWARRRDILRGRGEEGVGATATQTASIIWATPTNASHCNTRSAATPRGAPDADCGEVARRLKNDAQTRPHPDHWHVRICGNERAPESHCHGLQRVRSQTDRVRVSGRHHSAHRCEPEIIHPLCWAGWRAAQQTHGEHRALARLARHRHVAAHHARELAGDGEAEWRKPAIF